MQAQLDIKRTTWLGYEKGKSQPYLKELIRISDFFGITETDLLHTDIEVVGNLINSTRGGKYSKTGNLTSKGKGNLTVKNEAEQDFDLQPFMLNEAPPPAITPAVKLPVLKISEKQPQDYTLQEFMTLFRSYIVKILDIDQRVANLEKKKPLTGHKRP